jgi:putative acetyltransferase
VVVLGHPSYYPRFGFAPASTKNIACEYEAPDEAFMMLELTAGYLSGAEGTIRYHDAFGEAT